MKIICQKITQDTNPFLDESSVFDQFNHHNFNCMWTNTSLHFLQPFRQKASHHLWDFEALTVCYRITTNSQIVYQVMQGITVLGIKWLMLNFHIWNDLTWLSHFYKFLFVLCFFLLVSFIFIFNILYSKYLHFFILIMYYMSACIHSVIVYIYFFVCKTRIAKCMLLLQADSIWVIRWYFPSYFLLLLVHVSLSLLFLCFSEEFDDVGMCFC